ncbi:hypothetical protein BJV74DRAFT_815715 [Russula compacta]|nr:hypothetical protein BJV74DRAFT_815715 [Russula compacta]
MSTIVSDVLLSAGFLAYGGFFDQHYREVMWQEWITSDRGKHQIQTQTLLHRVLIHSRRSS